MHEAALLVVGSTIAAFEAVLGGAVHHAFGPAGGLHHAHRDRSAGFCIYNDCAIAIERATRARPGIRVAYIDIDVHHGDGVQEAFYDRADVLTISVHESGAYLYPGTGHVHEMGSGAGHGFALSVPLLPGSGPECHRLVLAEAVGPALRAFRPDMIVLQGGADTHRDDPLAGLDNTVRGYVDTVAQVVALAGELCGGRLAMVGGGGYESYSAVPRMWAASMAVLAGLPVPDTLPPAWLEASHDAAAVAGSQAPPAAADTFAEGSRPVGARRREAALEAARTTVARLHRAHPLFAKVS
jgi:acetoin utilization protein AcuC